MNNQTFSPVLALVFLLFSSTIFCQANLTFPVNVWQAIQSYQATVTHSPTDIGSTVDIFDGNFSTLARSANVNPFVVTLVFDYTINVSSMSTMQNNGFGWWTVEAANSLADLNSHTGSYQVLFSQSPLAQDVIATVPVSTSKKAFRLTMQKTIGDGYVHLWDWGITATATVQIADLCLLPSQARLLKNNSFDWQVKGVDASGNKYDLPSGVNWSSSNTGIVSVNSGGLLTSSGSNGEANVTVSWNGLSKTKPVKVVDDFTMPLAPQKVVKVALVIIDPQIPAAGGKRFSEVVWDNYFNMNWQQLNGGTPQQLANKVRDTLTALSGGVAMYQIVETHQEPTLMTTFGNVELSIDSMYHLFQEPGWATLHLVAEQLGQTQFHYNDLLNKYDFCTKSNNHQIDEVWVYAMPFIGMYESNMTGTGAFWINGPVITGNSCTDLLSILGMNYERSYDLALHNFTHRMETTMYRVFNTNVRYVPTDPPYPPGTMNELRQFMNFDALEPGKAHVGNSHFPPNAIENYGYYNTASVTSYEQNWRRYPFLFNQTRQLNCNDWECSHDGFMRWWLGRLPKYKCLDRNGYLNNWWLYMVDYNEGKAAEEQAGCNCEIFADSPPPPPQNYCLSYSNFPWEDWIAKVKLGTIDNASSKSTYSNFTNLSTNVSSGAAIELTTGFSYFTFDEYWKVWIDYNHDGIFTEPGEVAFSGVKTKPANGTATATLTGTLSIPGSALTGATRMRVSMKRNAYATPCEILPFGEVEDYTVNITGGGGGGLADLELTASANPTSVQSGTVHYSLSLTNKGPASASNVSVKHFPSGHFFIYENVVASAGSFDQNTRIWTVGNLAANATVTLSFNGLIVDQTTPQVDFFEVFTASPADPDSSPGNDNGSKTANEDDEAAVNLTPSNPADLSIILFSAPASGASGSSGNVSFTLQNSGSLPASSFKVGIYLSADNQWGASDVLVGETTPNLVPPMGSTTGSGSFTIAAATTPGNYFLILRADKDNQIFESNENNNTASTAFQVTGTGGGGTYCNSYSNYPWEEWIAKVELGNLQNASGKSTYSNFTNLSANLQAGNSYPITLTTGFSYFTWDEYWRVWIDFNHDGVFSTPDEVVNQQILTAPAPGTATASKTGSVNVPSSALPGATRMRVSMKRGAFPTSCETLPFGEVEDYTVNISTGTTQLANLLIPAYEIIPGGGGGSVCFTNPSQNFIHFGGLVLNNGTAAASAFTLKGWFSKDQQISANDVLWQSFSFTGVTPSNVVSWSFTNPVPASLAPGLYYILLKADADNVVTESNETDNTLTIQVWIGAPDFTVSNVSGVPVSTNAGSNFNVSVEATNISAFPFAELPGNLTASIYLSANNQFSSNDDVQIGTGQFTFNQFSNPPLHLNGKATATIPVSIPPGTSAGNYYVFVVLSASCEQTTNNNVSSAVPLQVTGSGPATYCQSFSNFPWHEWIAKVKIGSLDNSSSKSVYSDFTALSANLQVGNSYPITLTTGFSYFTFDEYWRVWIDFNHDGVFSTPNEVVNQQILTAPANGTATANVTGSVNIPANASLGATRMRVSMKRGAYPTACETLPFGEVEDYTVNIASSLNEPGTGDRADNVQLEAVAEAGNVQLFCAWSQPENLAAATVEKSADGIDFQPLVQLEAEPTAAVQALDETPFNGFNFYRLRLELTNGEVRFSPVRIVSLEGLDDVAIFPNPAQAEVFIHFEGEIPAGTSVQIFNGHGQLVLEKRLAEGETVPFRIGLERVGEGMYFAFVQRAGCRALGRRFVIVR